MDNDVNQIIISPKPPGQCMRKKSSFRTKTIKIKKNILDEPLFGTKTININNEQTADNISPFMDFNINSKPCSPFTEFDFNIYMKCFIHELQTPISNISLGLNLLENKSVNDSNIICDLNNTISYIENIFTQFVTVHNSNIRLNKFEPFNMEELIINIKSILRYDMLKTNIQFKYYIDIDVPKCLYGDSHNIKHVLINIIKNAIKYSEETRNNVILLNIKTNKNIIIISILDTNAHILPDIKEKLFESFNSSSGSGLGLYICKTIIELHGGKIFHEFLNTIGNKFILHLELDGRRPVDLVDDVKNEGDASPDDWIKLGDYDLTHLKIGYNPKLQKDNQSKNIQYRKVEENLFYFQCMRQSEFCLCPRGDAPWSFRFYEILMCESIPIVNNIHDTYRTLEESLLDYKFLLKDNEISYDELIIRHNTKIFRKNHLLN